MSAFLSIVGFFLFLAGVISVIYPLKFLRITSRKMALLVLLAGIAITSIGAATGTSEKQPPTQTTTVTSTSAKPASESAAVTTKEAPKETPVVSKPKPRLEVLNVAWDHEAYVDYATGTIKNNTDHTYKYVQVEINLYDGQGNQVGSTMANVNNLEPGATWKFKALIPDSNAKSFKVKDVTGF